VLTANYTCSATIAVGSRLRSSDRVLDCLNDPIRLAAHGYDQEIVGKIRSLVGTESPKKADVLHVLRNRDFARTEVTCECLRPRARQAKHVPGR